MNSTGRYFVVRLILRRSVCACVLLGASVFLCLPEVVAQGKSGPQKTFATPTEATKALGAAYRKGDPKAVADILGDKGWRLVFSGDPVIDRHERAWFLSLFKEGHEAVSEGDTRAILQLGKNEQPYPIPIVRKGSRWRFDPSEGHEDLLSRRMRKTELSTLDVVLAYVEAQRAYHEAPRRGDGVREYAQKFRSTPGQRDGLFWERQPGKTAGPLAGLVEVAGREGYGPTKEGEVPIYRGYAYRILTAQGPHAPGGARDYLVNGRMTEGYALVAFPLRYGVSGVMTFLVNQEGVVYQKDLGEKTGELGQKMTHFDPDQAWTKGQAN